MLVQSITYYENHTSKQQQLSEFLVLLFIPPICLFKGCYRDLAMQLPLNLESGARVIAWLKSLDI